MGKPFPSQPQCPVPSVAGGRGGVSRHHHRQPNQLSSLCDPGHEQERCGHHLTGPEKR